MSERKNQFDTPFVDLLLANSRIRELEAENALLQKHFDRAQSAESDVAHCVLRAEAAEGKVARVEALRNNWLVDPDHYDWLCIDELLAALQEPPAE